MANEFQGLARGPIDHNASSVINAISADIIDMGSAVKLSATGLTELLPRVIEIANELTDETYGIVVGGDNDGIYGDGTKNTGLVTTNLASNKEGDAVVVVTQGRCLARVETTVEILLGDQLGATAIGSGTGALSKAVSTNRVIARALQPVGARKGSAVFWRVPERSSTEVAGAKSSIRPPRCVSSRGWHARPSRRSYTSSSRCIPGPAF